MPVHHRDQVERLAAKALASGGVMASAMECRWNIAGRCQYPVGREMLGRSPPVDGRRDIVVPAEGSSLVVAMEVPCRQCQWCLKRRAAVWRARSRAEIAMADRTWMGTLTLSPDAHFRMLSQARRRFDRNGDDLDAMPFEVVFRERHAEIGKEITKFVKRLREDYGAKLRLLIVAEAHKSGLPHYHALIHQVTSEQLTWRSLDKQWRLGFSKWKLVDERAAGYVCKYLTKSALARVRASAGYGETALVDFANALDATRRA